MKDGTEGDKVGVREEARRLKPGAPSLRRGRLGERVKGVVQNERPQVRGKMNGGKEV